jgi:hypothetical protein
VNVVVNSQPTVTASASQTNLCTGGSIQLNGSATGGSLPYNFQWTGPSGFSSGQQSPLISGISTANAGIYSLQVTDGNGCGSAVPQTVTIAINNLPLANAGTDVSIANGAFTSLSGSATGGSGNYSYAWTPTGFINGNSNQAVVQTVNLSSSQTYTLVVTDVTTGCISLADQVVVTISGTGLSVNASSASPNICVGGSVQLNAIATGGTGTYSYSWSSSPIGFTSSLQNPVVSPAANTTYSVTVNDGFNNAISTVSIIVLTRPTATAGAVQNPICAGQTFQFNGSGSGGSGSGYTFFWAGPSGYNSTSQNPQLNNVQNVNAGVYLLTVTDGNGCASQNSAAVNVVVTNLPVANAGPDQTIAYGTSTSIAGSASGGSGSYSYLWAPTNKINGSASQATIQTSNLNSDQLYSLTVTDVTSGCVSISDQVTIHITGFPLSASASASPTQVCSGSNTTLNVQANGGSGNYTYSWSTSPAAYTSSQQSFIANPTQSMVFTVTVSDGFNIITSTVNVTVFQRPTASASAIQTAICTGSNIQLQGSASGGSGTGFIYQWIGPGGFNSSLQNPVYSNAQAANSGSYSLIVTDDRGCVSSNNASVNITVNNRPTAIPTVNNSSVCQGGSFQLGGNATGGSGIGYSYQWSGPNSFSSAQQNPAFSNAQIGQSGNYFLTVTDGGGCTSVNSAFIGVTVHSKPTALAFVTVAGICSGSAIQLSGSGSGGSGSGYTFQWTGPNGYISTSGSPSISNAQTINSGTYNLEVTDGNNCTSVPASVSVTVNALPLANAGPDQSLPNGAFANLSGSASAGSGNYTYSWSPISYISGNPFLQNISTINLSGTQTFSLTVHDITSGCQSLPDNVTVAITGSALSAFIIPSSSSVCVGSSTELNTTVQGGSGIYTYAWSSVPAGFTSTIQNPTVSPLVNTTFTVTVYDGFSSVIFVQPIAVNTKPSASVNASQTIFCAGGPLQLTGSASGGSGSGYSYAWTGPNSFSSSLQNPAISNAQANQSGSYSLIVTDANFCSSLSASVNVIIHALPVASANAIDNTICSGENLNLIGVATGGSNSGYQFTWTGPGGFTSINQNPQITNAQTINAGQYILAVGDGNGCVSASTSSINISVSDRPVANAGANQVVPMGAVTTLLGSGTGGTGNYAYSWAPASFINGSVSQALIQTIALNATQVYSLTVTDAITGCASSPDAATIIVSGGPLTATAQATGTSICFGASSVLNVLVTGGSGTYTYSWTSSPSGFTSTLQNPTVTPSISTLFIVSVNDGFSTTTSSIMVNVNPLPFVAISGPLSPQCTNNTFFTLNTGSPAGGTYSGPGVSGSNFNASVAGQGTHTITYQVSNVNGCLNSASTTIQVNQVPVVSYSASFSSLCASSIYYLLDQGTPSGGTYSGAGVNGNLFNASVAGAGTHTISYTYTNSNGCSGTVSNPLIVNPVPSVLFNNILPPQCQSTTIYTLNGGSPSGGTYSGPGVSSGNFNPSLSGPGTIDLVYQYTSGLGCVNSDTNQILVNQAPTPFPLSGGGTYCEGQNGLVVTLSGSQSGVLYQLVKDGSNFGATVTGNGNPISWPGMTGGIYTVSATYQAVLCSATMPGSITVTMVSLPLVQTVTGPSHYCFGSSGAVISLSGSQTGVLYQLVKNGSYIGNPLAGTGQGLSWSNQTAGTYTVVALSSQGSCIVSMNGAVTTAQDAPITLSLTPDPAIIVINNNLQLNAVYSGGSGTFTNLSWTGTGAPYLSSTSISNPVFNSSIVSEFGLTFTLTDNHNCSISAAMQIQATSPVAEPQMDDQQRCGTGSVTMEAVVGSGGNQVQFSLDGVNVDFTDNTFPYQYTTPVILSNTSLVVYARSRNSSSGNFSNWISATASASSGSDPGMLVGGSDICLGGSTGNLILLNYIGQVIQWEHRINGGSWSVINFTADNYEEIPAVPGNHGYRAMVQLQTCLPVYSNEITVNVSPATVSGSLSGGVSPVCFGNGIGPINLSGNTGSVLYWEKRVNGGFWTQINITNSYYSEVPTAPGAWEYRAIVKSGECEQLNTNAVLFNVQEQVVMGTLTGSGSVCQGLSTPNLVISGQQGTITKWQKRFNGGSWTDISNTNAFYAEIPASAGNWDYRVVMQNSACTEQYSNVVTVTVLPASNGGTLNGSANICFGGSTGALVLTGYSGLIIKWQKKFENGSWTDFYNFSAAYQEVPTSPGTWYYRVLVQSGSCGSSYSVAATVYVYNQSVGGTVTGGSEICTGSATGTLTLTGYSGTIMKWQKRYNGANWSDIPNQSPIFGEVLVQSGTWEYRALTQSGSCPVTYSVLDTVIVLPLSNGGAVNGGSSFCFGNSTQVMTLTGNTGTIVKWQKRLNNGSWIDITNTTANYQETPASAGTWDYRAVVKNGLCSQSFSQFTSVIVNALPTVYLITGNSFFCDNENGVTLTLTGSEPGVSYQLVKDGINEGFPVTGNGNSISWQNQYPGVYKVLASGLISFCAQPMQGEITVNMIPSPQQFSVTSYGYDCAGQGGGHVVLSGSENGFSYQLFRSNIAIGQPKIGTGLNLDWDALTVGNYSVTASNILTNCQSQMYGTAVITQAALPLAYNVTGGGTVCQNSAGIAVGLSSSQTGVSYMLYFNGIQTSTMVLGTGSAITFGPQNQQGNYTVQASNNSTSCQRPMNGNAVVTVIAAPQVELGADMSVFYGTSLVLNPSVSGGISPYSYVWVPPTYLSNPNTANPTASPLDTTTYTLIVTDANNCSGSDIITINPIIPAGQSAVSGKITYGNSPLTPLHDIPVYLKTTGGSILMQTTTDVNGNYLFPPFPSGTYVLTAASNQTTGGYNSTDALLILRHFVQLQPLSGIWLLAADVDNTNYVNAVDALAVQKRFVGALAAYPAGKWVFEKRTIAFNNGIFHEDLLGLCYGDVNGSYIPSKTNTQPINLVEAGRVEANENNQVQIPVYLDGVNDLGAVSLYLDINPDELVIDKVEIVGSDDEAFYKIVDGNIVISWVSLSALKVDKQKPVLMLSGWKKTGAILSNWAIASGEFADPAGKIIKGLRLILPEISSQKKDLRDFSVQLFPNPAIGRTEVYIGTSSIATSNVYISDMQGRLLMTEKQELPQGGINKHTLDLSAFLPGVYFIKIQVSDINGISEKVRKLEILK